MTAQAKPNVVSRTEWLAARTALLVREKEATRIHDAVAAERRRLPMVKVEANYVFNCERGEVSLIDLFEGRRQLFIHHFMWIDALDQCCPRCAEVADLNFNETHLAHLKSRDVTFAAIARAPWSKLAPVKARNGWTFPWYSSYGNTFNADMHVTLDEQSVQYNYRSTDEMIASGVPKAMLNGDFPGSSVFLCDGTDVYHAYSSFARGGDLLFTPYNYLDLTPFGRQESWEDSPPGWPQRPTYG
jgi:predicted dithiol-disulfide oxidoreductase (DUF899 family)